MTSASTPAARDAASGALVDDPRALDRYTRWIAPRGADGVALAESSLRLSGLHCSACAGTIEAALARAGGVAEASVNAATQTARVRWDPRRTRASALIAAVQRAGYGAVPD